MDSAKQPAVSKKDPVLAGILSALIVGLGQVYNGQVAKGLLMFGGALVGVFLTFGLASVALWIFSIYDAYHTAKDAQA